MNLPHICIEITRKCNLRCRHCLRGEPEFVNIDFQKLEKILKIRKVNRISAVTLSGGEPSLNIKGLIMFAAMIRRLKIKLDYFYLATNGTNDSRGFFKAIQKCFSVTTYPQECILAISRTSFHFESMRKLGISYPSIENIRHRIGWRFKDRVYTMGLGDAFEGGIVDEGRYWGTRGAIKPREDGIFINSFCNFYDHADISYKTQREIKPVSLSNFLKSKK